MLCPACGERNPEGARFCLRCGAPLTGPGRRGEERKVVTVLFCDLVGFTARSDRADPEDVRATLVPYHASIKRSIEVFGGTIDTFVGDGVVGVFGAPVSHEDDPERAIRVGLRILEEIAASNDGASGPPLSVRIGIATGEAMVAVGPGPQVGERVTGEVVAAAMRLQSLAPVDGIAVDEATRRNTRGHFSFEALTGDGAAEAWRPVELARVVRERPRTPFVGRVEESALLRAAYRRAIAEPSVQLVTITGGPGLGKSRLLQEVADALEAEAALVRWRQGRCLPYGDGVGFWPLSEMVKAEAAILESDSAEQARGKLERTLGALTDDPSERDWMLARLAPLAGLGEVGGGDRMESYTAWRRFFEALAARHPLVMVFEDLHWADPALLGFIEHVVDWSTQLPMLIVCAARPELYELWPGWGGGKRNSASISLPALSETETAVLLSGLLDRAVLPADTQRVLLERSGGNPLYAEEFVQMLTDRGILEKAGRSMRLAADREIPVPETIQAIIAARLDTLPHETKALLQDASLIGKVFWTGAVASVSGMDVDEVRRRLHEAAVLELIRPIRSSSMEGEEEYAFWHILVRDVATAQIPRSDRVAKHRAVAGWIESTAGERIADRGELLAYHYGRALELARATGADGNLEDLRDRTVRALVLAGDRAAHLDAGSAERHFRRAADRLPEEHPERPRILLRLADAQVSRGSFAASRRTFDLATAGLLAVDDMAGVGLALALKTRALQRLGDLRDSQMLLEEAISILEQDGPGPELARAYSRMAGHWLTLGRFERCRELAERALALTERFDLPDEAVRARQNLGAARCQLGDAEGLADLWAALRQGLELGIGVETAVTYANLATQLWLLEGPAIALQVWDSAVEFAEVRGFATEAMWSRCGRIEVLFDLGRWDEVERIASEVEAWDREEGGGQLRTFAQFRRTEVLANRGRIAEAVLLEEEFLPRVRILQRAEFLGPALTIGAALELRRGHEATALGLVEEFLGSTQEHVGYRQLYLAAAVRVLVACGATDRAEEVLGDEPPPRNQRGRLEIRAAEAALAEARGRYEEAAALYAAAAAGWLSYGATPERAVALLGEGRSRKAIGDPVAPERLRTARETFEALGAEPWTDEVDAVLTDAEAATP